MASKRAFEILAERIDQLGRLLGHRPAQAVVVWPWGTDEAAVVEAHMQLHPRDRNAEMVVLVREFGDAYRPPARFKPEPVTKPVTKGKGGRPRLGAVPMTPAERKRRQRERERQAAAVH